MNGLADFVPGVLNDDVDRAVQPPQHAQQPLDGDVPKAAAEQSRDVGLADSDQPRRGALAKAALGHHGGDLADEPGLGMMASGIGKAEIGEDIAAASFNLAHFGPPIAR
jgi:hypothetical protein